MEEFLATETFVIELLLVVSVVAILVRRIRLPYTVALVVVGLLITFQQDLQVDLTPELILALFVPPLIFEAAFHLDFARLRDNLTLILFLAIPGVLLTTVLVAIVVAAGVGISFQVALVFGALISATDPVAVIALFRALGAPRRLAVLIEGESLLNDGTAIVVYSLVLSAALVGSDVGADAQSTGLGLLTAAIEFLRVSLGGVVVGVGLGWAVSLLIYRVDDYLIETTLTTVLAFGAYLVAERFGVSGVLAVVSAGIIAGNVVPKGMSPTTKIVLFNFWEYLAFVTNSLVFLLIGLDVDVRLIIANVGPIAIAVLAVILSRALVVYGLTWAVTRVTPRVPWAYQHVLFWGGLRGAIGLALALSLPETLADRELLRIMAFGVVLFTLLAQGTTINPLLRRLGLVRQEEIALEYERSHGRMMAARAALERLEQLQRDGIITASTYHKVAPSLEEQVQTCVEAQRVLLHENPSLQSEELRDARREGLRAGRAMLAAMLSDGVISEQAYEDIVSEIDGELDSSSEVEPLAQEVTFPFAGVDEPGHQS